MKDLSYYAGREQTYIKHFFLERYLERVAYNIYSFAERFVYVDGFSGPWRSKDEKREDTSFVIALQKLRHIKEGFAKRGRAVDFRCFFVERDTESYQELAKSIQDFNGIQIEARNASFEDSIREILQFVGRDFALVFIDPTGWTGFPLRRIAELLRHSPGEVIINFMFDDINRHLTDPRPEQYAGFADFFAIDDWSEELARLCESGLTREQASLQLYMNQLKQIGRYPHVTYTRVLKPLSDRTYFYLIYATRHLKGLIEFRHVERNAVREQERIRFDVKQLDRTQRTGQAELFQEMDLHESEETIT
jgi:three-Cys-motif partner protein